MPSRKLDCAAKWTSRFILMAACLGTVGLCPGQNIIGFRVASVDLLEPGKPLSVPAFLENTGTTTQAVSIQYVLQVNAQWQEPRLPDPVLGFDHALGATNQVMVEGVIKGDALLCDGDESTSYETPWSRGYREVVATIQLQEERDITAVHWHAGDANWIWKGDVAVSSDGSNFVSIAAAQNVSMHQRWGGPHVFPWPEPVRCRVLRLRFHNGGAPTNTFRLPASIRVYDGAANDNVVLPKVGALVESGRIEAGVAPGETREVHLTGTNMLGTGAYYLGLEVTAQNFRKLDGFNLLVGPTDEVAPDKARRFGVNGNAGKSAVTRSLRRCGFGWVRFENAKWMMYMPERDHAAFDGSVAPWHVNLDRIFTEYRQTGLQVLPYVFQTPEWATSAPPDRKQNRAGYPPRNAADYGDAVYQLVARYGSVNAEPDLLKTADKKSGLGLIHAVELWNEPNLNDPNWGPFVGSMAEYFEVMRAGVEGARRADSRLPVTAGGLAGIGLDIVGLLAEHRYPDGKRPLDLIDVVNVHFYSGREEPELAGWDPNATRNRILESGTTYPEQLEDLVAWRDVLKPTAAIWLTETGNDVGGPIGRTERHQAAKVPRAVLLAMAAGVERVFIYREAGSNPAMHAGAGLLRNDGSTRPVWLSVATMIRQLQGVQGRALRLATANPNVWLFLWDTPGKILLTGWTPGAATPLGIELGGANLCDAFGRVECVSSTRDVELGYFPTYLTLESSSPAFSELVERSKTNLKLRAQERARLASLSMLLLDFGRSDKLGMLQGFGPPRRFTAVGKDTLWGKDTAFGFLVPGISEVDWHWVADALERDGVRVEAGQKFRFRIGRGHHRVRVGAAAWDQKQPWEVLLARGETQQRELVPVGGRAEFLVEGGPQPLEIWLNVPGALRWITAIPERQTN